MQSAPVAPENIPTFRGYTSLFIKGSARDRRALQPLALNVHVKHSDLT